MLGKNDRWNKGERPAGKRRPSAPIELPPSSYVDRPLEPVPAANDIPQREAVAAHVASHIGQPALIFNELLSETVHIDVHVVNPTTALPFYTLITSGMSSQPMTVPPGMERCQYAEMVICLPPDWEVSPAAFRKESSYWPVRWLKILARFPHLSRIWLWEGHTVPNGSPPLPYAAETQLCCALLGAPVMFGKDFLEMAHPNGGQIRFLSLIPLYKEEMDLKLDAGYIVLAERLRKAGVTELLDVHRPNTAQRRWWFLGQ